MADQKLTQLDAATTLADDDLVYVVDDVAGTPGSKKLTGANLKASFSGAYVAPGDDAATLGSDTATDGHVLTADGAGGAAWEAAAGGGGDASGTYARITYLDRWNIPSDVAATALSTAPLDFANYAYFVPFHLDREVSMTDVGINVTGASDTSGAVIRLGVFARQTNGLPGTVLQQATVTADAAGLKTWSLSPALTVGPGFVYVAVAAQDIGGGTIPQTRRVAASGVVWLTRTGASTADYSESIGVAVMRTAGTATGAFTDNPGVGVYNNFRPYVEIRVT